MIIGTAATLFLADSSTDVDPDTGHGPEWGAAAPIGLLVVVLMCVAGYFLAKSFSKHMKRVPESFDDLPGSVSKTADSTSVADPAPVAVADRDPVATSGGRSRPPNLTGKRAGKAGSSGEPIN